MTFISSLEISLNFSKIPRSILQESRNQINLCVVPVMSRVSKAPWSRGVQVRLLVIPSMLEAYIVYSDRQYIHICSFFVAPTGHERYMRDSNGGNQ